MFLFDSYDSLKNRKTEPFWFRILRFLFAIIFTFLLLKYNIYDNFSNVLQQATIKSYQVSNGSELRLFIFMCGNGVTEFDVQELPLDNFNTNKNTSKPSKNCQRYTYSNTNPDPRFGLWINANIPFNNIDNSTINNSNQLNGIINSFYEEKKSRNINMLSILPNNNLKLTIIMSLKLSDTEQECNSTNSNAFYFNPNQVFFVHVTPSVTSLLLNCRIDLNIQSEQLPLNLDTNQVGLGIYVNSPTTYETKQIYSFMDYLSDLGGFYGFISETFAFIFGSDKLGPWGIAQLLILSGIPCIRSFTKNLAKVYVSPGGIPLAENVKDRPKTDNPETRALVMSLEERVQILETLLKEYYLDDSYLVKVRDFIVHHKDLEDKLKEMKIVKKEV